MADLTTLSRVKEYLELDPDFVQHDALLKRLIKAMTQTFLNRTRRYILNTSVTEVLNGDDQRIRFKPYAGPFLTWLRAGSVGYQLELRYTPVVSLDALVIDGVPVPAATNLGQPTQTDGFVLLDNHTLILVGSTYVFTKNAGNVSITYTAGYGTTVPDDVEDAVIEMVAWRYNKRRHQDQVQKTTGTETITFSQLDFPSSVTAVLDDYTAVHV